MNVKVLSNSVPKMGIVDKVIKKGAESGFVNKMVQMQSKNPNFYPNFVLGLIILQNLVGTATYTYASWNNTGMPKEQRKFAAAIDLMNGIFNFGIILTVGRWINNNSDKWAEMVAKPFRNLRQTENYMLAKKGFRSFLTIVVAGVLVQRVVVPFFSTPCAKWFKEKYLSGDKKNSQVTMTGNKLNAAPLAQMVKAQPINENSPFASFERFQQGLNKVA